MKSITFSERSGNTYSHADDSIVSSKLLGFCESFESVLSLGLEVLLLLPVEVNSVLFPYQQEYVSFYIITEIVEEAGRELDSSGVFSASTNIYLNSRTIPCRLPGFKLNAIAYASKLVEACQSKHVQTSIIPSIRPSSVNANASGSTSHLPSVASIVHVASPDCYVDSALLSHGLIHTLVQSRAYNGTRCVNGAEYGDGNPALSDLFAKYEGFCESLAHNRANCSVMRLMHNVVAGSVSGIDLFPEVVSVYVDLMGSKDSTSASASASASPVCGDSMWQEAACGHVALCGGVVGMHTLLIGAR